LANGLGNLVSRVMKMAIDHNVVLEKDYSPPFHDNDAYLREYQFNKALDAIWSLVGQADGYIQVEQPFKVIKSDEAKGKFQIQNLLRNLTTIASRLQPFMPDTAQKIEALIKEHRMPDQPLFARKN
jgi:methionyl-tRNA synthetase